MNPLKYIHLNTIRYAIPSYNYAFYQRRKTKSQIIYLSGGFAMHLGSIYLIVNDFEKSIAFYEKLLKVPLESGNNGRFVSFAFEGHRISLLNAHFDVENPDKVERKGEDAEVSSETLRDIAIAPNTHKFVFNF